MQGGCIRATNQHQLLSNVTLAHCHGLSTAAGLYLESNDVLDAQVARDL